jgi:hypothetical protein
MSPDRQRERALLYLYDEMSPEERTAFEKELSENPALRALLDREERFQRACPVGAGHLPPDDLLTESRLLLRLALRRERERGTPLLRRLADILRPLSPQARYAFGAVALLLLGLVLGRTAFGPAHRAENGAWTTPGALNPDRLEVVDLRVTAFDPSTGAIKLSFATASGRTLEGNLRDEAIQNVLAASLRGDLEAAARLEAVDLMQRQTASARVREALIYALRHDENPGVRIKAVEALKGLVRDEPVRLVLVDALAHDKNAGVRIEAIEALKQFHDPATLRVLKQRMTTDDNPYIRAEAQRAVLKWTGHL